MNTETLAVLKGIYSKDTRDMQKAITTGYGLVSIDLQAPSKNLYPVLTPLRNVIPRVSGNGGLSTQWRSITAIKNSTLAAQAFIPEGQRAAAMQYQTANLAAPYVTIGADDYITFEAIEAAKNFEDLHSTMTMRLLQRAMINEELAILGGNRSVLLGTPAMPSLSVAGSTGTLPAATYSVIVVALTMEGWLNAMNSTPNMVMQTSLITGMDGLTYNYNGGSSNKSAANTQAVTLGQILTSMVTPIRGALAYAWFIGLAGAETLQAITTTTTATFSAPLAAGQQAATAITADCSANPNLAFDGLLYNALNPANLAYFKDMAASTLTASSKGSVNEIDVALKTMWDTYRLGPDVIYVNSQEQQNITVKVLNASSGPLLRFNTDGKEPFAIVANDVVAFYYNPFDISGGRKIPVKIHPNLPPGTIMLHCQNLPGYYMNSEVPQVAEVHCRRDYYEQEWPVRTRRYEHGVYASEVLAVYATFGLGVITNVANG